MLFEPCGELRRDYGAYCETLRLTEREDIFSQVYTNFEYEKEKERRRQQQLHWQKILSDGTAGPGKEDDEGQGGKKSPQPPGGEGGEGVEDEKDGEWWKSTGTAEGGSGTAAMMNSSSAIVPKLPLDAAGGRRNSTTNAKEGDGGGKNAGGAAAAGNRKGDGGKTNTTPRRSQPQAGDSRGKKKGSPISPRKAAEAPQEAASVAFEPLPRRALTFVRVRHPKFCLNQRDMTPLCRAIPYCLSLVSVEFIGAGLSMESYLLLTEAIYRSRRVVTVRIDFNAVRKPGGFVPDPTLMRGGEGKEKDPHRSGSSGGSRTPSTTLMGSESTLPVGMTPLGGGGSRKTAPRTPSPTTITTTTTTSPVRGDHVGNSSVDRTATPDSVLGGGQGKAAGTSELKRLRGFRRRSSSANSLLGTSGAAGSTPSWVIGAGAGDPAADESADPFPSSTSTATVLSGGVKEEPGDIFLKPSEYCGLHLLPTPLEDQIQEEREKKGKVDPKKLVLLQTQQETIQRFDDQHRVRLPRCWSAMVFTAVVHLSLRGNGIGDAEVGTMVRLLLRHSHSRLVSLNLWGNEITDVGAKSIALLLRHNRTLRALDVGHNHLGNSGLLEIIQTFRMIEMKSVEEVQAYRKRVLTRPNASEKERAAAQQVFSWNAIPTYLDMYNVWQAQKSAMSSTSNAAAGSWNGAGAPGGTIPVPPSSSSGLGSGSGTTALGGEEKSGSGGGGSKRLTSSKSSKTKEAAASLTLTRPTTPFDRECVRVTGSEPCMRVPGNTVLEVLNLAENSGVTLEGVQEVVRVLGLREPKTDEEMMGLTLRPRPTSAMGGAGRRWSVARGSHMGVGGGGVALSSTGEGKEEEGGAERRWSGASGGGASSLTPSPKASPPFSPSKPLNAPASSAGGGNPSHGGGGGGGPPPSPSPPPTTTPPATGGGVGNAANGTVLYSPELHCAAIRLRFCAVVHYRFSPEWKDTSLRWLGEGGGGWVGVGGGGGRAALEGGRHRVSFSEAGGVSGGGGGDPQGMETLMSGAEVPFSGSTSTLAMRTSGSGGVGQMASTRPHAHASSSSPGGLGPAPPPPSTAAAAAKAGGGPPPPPPDTSSPFARSNGEVPPSLPISPKGTPSPSHHGSLSKSRRSGGGGGPRGGSAATATRHGKKSSSPNTHPSAHSGSSSSTHEHTVTNGGVGRDSHSSSPSSRSSGSTSSPLYSHLSATVSGGTRLEEGSPLTEGPSRGSRQASDAGGGGGRKPSPAAAEGGTKILSIFPMAHVSGSAASERSGGGGDHEKEEGKHVEEGRPPFSSGAAVSREAFGLEETGEEIGGWEAMSAEQEKLNKCLDEWLRSELDALKPPTQEKSSAAGRRKNH